MHVYVKSGFFFMSIIYLPIECILIPGDKCFLIITEADENENRKTYLGIPYLSDVHGLASFLPLFRTCRGFILVKVLSSYMIQPLPTSSDTLKPFCLYAALILCVVF